MNIKRAQCKHYGGSAPEINKQIHRPPLSNNLLSSGQCLNIFQDDDQNFLSQKSPSFGLTGRQINKIDDQMDLRNSFQQLETTSPLDADKFSNNSFSTKQNNSLEAENRRLRQENEQLKKKMQQMEKNVKQVQILRKKYMSSIDQINRLQNERRTIITDKVKFQSKYHKQLQDKELLLRELENMKSRNQRK